MLKNDHTEVERDMDGFKEKIANTELQIEESMQKLRDAKTNVQSYVTKKELIDAISGVDKQIVKGVRKPTTHFEKPFIDSINEEELAIPTMQMIKSKSSKNVW